MLLNVATVQMDVQIRKPAENTQKVLGLFENAVAGGANLVVFPECAITGYGYGSRAEAEGGGIWIDGPELTKLIDACHKLNSYMVVGFAENAPDGLFNTAALIGPNGMIGCFRKCHLPFIGMDRYADRGGGLPVFDTPIGKFGILICYDIRFPEAARTMALEGIDVLIIPTNWPEQSEGNSDYICPARARENWIYVAAANRVGHESGFDFIGKSGIWDIGRKPP
jgi:predicted amidohydrolase